VYRIGQKRDVNVYTLHIESSIENWLHDIKVEKKCHTNILQNGSIDLEDITMSKLCRDISKKMYI
jgi:SNF2 family DNA or RNA helicase